MHIVLVLCVVAAISASFTTAFRCTLPNGDAGICKSLKDCDILTRISKKNKTPLDSDFLAHSNCPDKDTEAKVCCPNSDVITCITPDHYEGKCISLQSCPRLKKLFEDTKNGEMLKNYTCAGPDDNSACCQTAEVSQTPNEIECQDKATSFPPDANSECCGLDEAFNNKIVGGKATGIADYPWMAVIEYVKGNERFLMCGGSLISSRYVLTAAHCLKGSLLFIGMPKYVRLGEHDVTNRGPDCVGADAGESDCNFGAVIAPIERTVVHPQYRPYHAHRKHDIGLIRLKITVPYTLFIRPICLPQRDYTKSPSNKLIFWAAGWGTYIQNVTSKVYHRSHIKQHVDLPLVSREECQESIQKLRQSAHPLVLEGQICAGGVPGKDSCNSDSGGPLMYDEERLYQIVGIVSFGSQICGLENVPGVYTYVHDYVPWIKKAIKPYIVFYF